MVAAAILTLEHGTKAARASADENGKVIRTVWICLFICE